MIDAKLKIHDMVKVILSRFVAYNSAVIKMTDKRKKPKLKFTYFNPNTPEKTRELMKDIIVQIMLENTKETQNITQAQAT